VDNVVKQVGEILGKHQKKGDYNIKKRTNEELNNT
jgi:hypothetical protein